MTPHAPNLHRVDLQLSRAVVTSARAAPPYRCLAARPSSSTSCALHTPYMHTLTVCVAIKCQHSPLTDRAFEPVKDLKLEHTFQALSSLRKIMSKLKESQVPGDR
jgi:hypothetical protein